MGKFIIGNYFKQSINSVIVFRTKLARKIYFQVFKCDNLMVLLVLCHSILNIFGFLEWWLNKIRHLNNLLFDF